MACLYVFAFMWWFLFSIFLFAVAIVLGELVIFSLSRLFFGYAICCCYIFSRLILSLYGYYRFCCLWLFSQKWTYLFFCSVICLQIGQQLALFVRLFLFFSRYGFGCLLVFFCLDFDLFHPWLLELGAAYLFCLPGFSDFVRYQLVLFISAVVFRLVFVLFVFHSVVWLARPPYK